MTAPTWEGDVESLVGDGEVRQEADLSGVVSEQAGTERRRQRGSRQPPEGLGKTAVLRHQQMIVWALQVEGVEGELDTCITERWGSGQNTFQSWWQCETPLKNSEVFSSLIITFFSTIYILNKQHWNFRKEKAVSGTALLCQRTEYQVEHIAEIHLYSTYLDFTQQFTTTLTFFSPEIAVMLWQLISWLKVVSSYSPHLTFVSHGID